MISAHRLHDAHRLAVLHDLDIMDTPAEAAYNDIAALASACCGSEIAAVNFVDDQRHWTKAIVGVQDGRGASVSADVSFCAETVAGPHGLLSVPDTLADERWRSHPLVLNGPKVRFYAGASIVVAGQPVGVVCVFGDKPRPLGERVQQALEMLARQASGQLALRMRNAELRELSVKDPLTGLANRTLLEDRLQTSIAQRRRDGRQVGVLFCDVDGFKSVNDQLGHQTGDRLLCQIADRLRQATRATDTVARIAGDEFVVVCPGLGDVEELEAVVSRIDAIVHAPAADDATTPVAHLCIGAVLLEDGETTKDVLGRADEAMYANKISRTAAPAVA
jgi:diguanylate cyclase (GGDEF)-like protein